MAIRKYIPYQRSECNKFFNLSLSRRSKFYTGVAGPAELLLFDSGAEVMDGETQMTRSSRFFLAMLNGNSQWFLPQQRRHC